MRCSCCACCRASSCSLYWFSSASLRILLARSCSFFNFILSILSASSSGVSLGCTSVNLELYRSIPLQYLRLPDDWRTGNRRTFLEQDVQVCCSQEVLLPLL